MRAAFGIGRTELFICRSLPKWLLRPFFSDQDYVGLVTSCGNSLYLGGHENLPSEASRATSEANIL